jgi:hypothetical protein
VDKELKAAIREIQQHYAEKLKKDCAEAWEHSKEARIKAYEEKLRYETLTKDFTTIMTMDDFRLIRGCLHPDRARDDEERAKLNKAFEKFNRLEKQVNKYLPISELRKTGWDKKSPYYNRAYNRAKKK